LNPQLFLFEYGFRPHASGEFSSAANPDIFESALQSGKKEIRNESDNAWTVNPDIFESDDVAKSCPVAQRVGLVSLEGIRIPSDARGQANSI